ncbi:autophagy-related protein 16-1-like [Dreissena polymorpha]|uniref:Autophagy-related protein 16 domain-containing protein n=2 Tax=Dreissena polymorpha TaxID=45954 RepID=A0A9D4G252_DREPO|nr:autophagy-related protein 16-1-like [Dreissena polymorpha]KAH3808816.1 hypothetical protein DPMN_137175 [Dreissena polymorpha]
MANGTLNWKSVIYDQLKARNSKERYRFTELIETQSRLFDVRFKLQSENIRLAQQTQTLRTENLSLQTRAQNIGDNSAVWKVDRVKQLEDQVKKAQEELLDLTKRKGENTQVIVELTKDNNEKDFTLKSVDEKLDTALKVQNDLQELTDVLKRKVNELEQTNQWLKEEQDILNKEYSTLNDETGKMKEEFAFYLNEYMELKKLEVEQHNIEAEESNKKFQAQQKKIIDSAAGQQVDIKEDPEGYEPRMAPICYAAQVPTKAQYTWEAHDGEVNAVLWSRTGAQFATGGSDCIIKVWDYKGGQCSVRGLLLGSNGGITSLEYDLEEVNLLAASNDKTCRLWSLNDQRLWVTLTGHSSKVCTAKFLRDSSKVVSGSQDGTLKIWDVKLGACSKTFVKGSGCSDLVTLHGSFIISGHSDKRVRFWDSRVESCTNSIELDSKITSLDLSPDRTLLLVCTKEDGLIVVDLRQTQVIKTLGDQNFIVGCERHRAVFSPDGKYTAAGSINGHLIIWNFETGKVEKTLQEHTNAILSCSWHPAGSYVLTSDRKKKVVLWTNI